MASITTIVVLTLGSELWILLELFGIAFAIYLGFLFVIFVHELGHLLAGFMCGFQRIEFRVGILTWGKGLSFKINWWDCLSGSVKMIPVKNTGLRLRFFVYALAGPSANFALAVLLYLLAVWSGNDGFLGPWIVVSIFIGAVNLIPLRRGRRSTDGMKALSAILCSKIYLQFQFGALLHQKSLLARELMHKHQWQETILLVEQLQSSGKDLMPKQTAKALEDVLALAHRGLQSEVDVNDFGVDGT